jgi:hypothetical protein
VDIANSTITNNTGDGIAKIGSGTGSHFNSNMIHTNGELGIDLLDNGVTANDAGDADTGPNNLQNFPVINYVRRGDSVANFTLNSANGTYRIQFYSNTTCDASGNGEGEVLLATQNVTVAGNTFTGFSAALTFGAREQITAIATSDPNNKSSQQRRFGRRRRRRAVSRYSREHDHVYGNAEHRRFGFWEFSLQRRRHSQQRRRDDNSVRRDHYAQHGDQRQRRWHLE